MSATAPQITSSAPQLLVNDLDNGENDGSI
jgi:hypothetical protein